MTPPTPAAETTLLDLGMEALNERLSAWTPLRDLLPTFDDGEPRIVETTPPEIVDEPKAEHFPVVVFEGVDSTEGASRFVGSVRYQVDVYVWPADEFSGARPYGLGGLRRLDSHVSRLLRKGSNWRAGGVRWSSSRLEVVRNDTPPDGPYVRGRRGTIESGG